MIKKSSIHHDAYTTIERLLTDNGYNHEEAQEMISQLIREEACYYVDAMRSIYGEDFGKDRYEVPVNGNYLNDGWIELEAEMVVENNREKAIENIVNRMEELNFDNINDYNDYIFKYKDSIF